MKACFLLMSFCASLRSARVFCLRPLISSSPNWHSHYHIFYYFLALINLFEKWGHIIYLYQCILFSSNVQHKQLIWCANFPKFKVIRSEQQENERKTCSEMKQHAALKNLTPVFQDEKLFTFGVVQECGVFECPLSSLPRKNKRDYWRAHNSSIPPFSVLLQ